LRGPLDLGNLAARFYMLADLPKNTKHAALARGVVMTSIQVCMKNAIVAGLEGGLMIGGAIGG